MKNPRLRPKEAGNFEPIPATIPISTTNIDQVVQDWRSRLPGGKRFEDILEADDAVELG